MQITTVHRISDITQADWQRCFNSSYPFTQYGFMLALERGNSVGPNSGWLPHYLVLQQHDGTAMAIMLCYLKTHSYGEYLFDWAIADAYRQLSLQYYPKLLSAVPFTPASGPRLGVANGVALADVMPEFEQALQQLSQNYQASGYQCWYPDNSLAQQLTTLGWWQRQEVQFHWHNRNYKNFSAFLSGLTSRKRKAILKERSKVSEAGITFTTLSGQHLTAPVMTQLYQFYCRTYQKRAGHTGYLTADTFALWQQYCADQLVVFAAWHQQKMVAAALCFRSDNTLYGRYWGCADQFDMLHFDACYYQGIEYCIQQGLGRFEAGAQGEHKLQRGFEPVICYGYFRLAEQGLNTAVVDFCQREAEAINRYAEQARQLLPFKQQ